VGIIWLVDELISYYLTSEPARQVTKCSSKSKTIREVDVIKLKKINRENIRIFFLFLAINIFMIFMFPNSIFAKEVAPMLRVGIFLNQNEINISGDGVFKIYNLKLEGLIGEENNKIIKMLPHEKGIEILGKGVYSGPIKIVPVGKTKIIVLINGQKYRYRGDIEVDIKYH
jgi:stage II sporulation protein D